jgi:EAL domain-containing protein (putative c-di-GMP-specific phosphodiesterase class I)
VRFFQQRRTDDERLLWTRDIRFANRLAQAVPDSRLLELDAGMAVIAPGASLTEALATDIARATRSPEYGLVTVDARLAPSDRYVVALSAAVQVSGLADRIGMARSTQLIQTRTLDYFFNLRQLHAVQFQPIVNLASGELQEYEALFRPEMPMLPQSISAIVQAAIDTDRSVELDRFIVKAILARAGSIQAARALQDAPLLRVAVNVTPASLLDPAFEAGTLAEDVRAAGMAPGQITIECTEQQSVADVLPLKRQVRRLRRLGFGFAVDDAGAGYASFALVAALRPSLIKIDREIVARVARDDAKQALVEAFVSFGRRIGARLVAEGIEKRADLAELRRLGVDLGQGFLLGRPSREPMPPRRLEIWRAETTTEGARPRRATRRVSAAAD